MIGATAKPLYAIDGKAGGLDRRNPKTSLFEGGGPPQRWKEFAHRAPADIPQTLDFPIPIPPSSREGDRPQAVEGVAALR